MATLSHIKWKRTPYHSAKPYQGNARPSNTPSHFNKDASNNREAYSHPSKAQSKPSGGIIAVHQKSKKTIGGV